MVFGKSILIWMIPLIGALIGWVTNYLAIKLLFHPKKPIDLKVFVLHGIFPKNKKKLATRLGTVVQKDLISFGDIKERLANPESLHAMGEEISVHVEKAIRDRLHATKLAETLVPEGVVKGIHQIVVSDIETTLPKMIDQYVDGIEEKIDIKKMVYEKVNNFSDDKLEELILAITSKEFKFIELIGAVLGFLIGCLQLILSEFVG